MLEQEDIIIKCNLECNDCIRCTDCGTAKYYINKNCSSCKICCGQEDMSSIL